MSMSKGRKKIDDPRQLNIFDQIAEIRAKKTDVCGAMRVVDELREAIDQSLKRTNLSRFEVAGKMSFLTGEEISKVQIDSWTCSSKAGESGRHIPAEYLPALARVTGCNEPILVITNKVELFAFEGKDALRSEIDKMEEDARELQREIRKRRQFLGFLQGNKGKY